MRQVLSNYVRHLCKTEYSINDTQKLPSMLPSIPLLKDEEEDVSYNIESLFKYFDRRNNQLYY